MDYYELAEQMFDLRASMPQFKMERTMNQASMSAILALNYLSANGNRAYPKDISKALMLTTARIAALLKVLEKRNLITRTPDPDDNRQTIVELTETGISIIEERKKEIIDKTAKMLEFLGEEDAKAYIRIQKRLAELGRIWM